MPKAKGKCKICGAPKLLNYAGLCKRCTGKPGASEFVDKALEKKRAFRKVEREMAEKAATFAAEHPEEGADAEGAGEGGEEAPAEEAPADE